MPARKEFDAILAAPFGALGVRISGETLVGLEFLPPDTPPRASTASFIRKIERELGSYFADPYADPPLAFRLPISLVGTEFRRRVWQTLMDIPAGRTVTYGELARRIGTSPRAVGQALGDNPIPLVVPCHRVVAVNGIGGFNHDAGGFSQHVKRWLLAHERAL